jgi:hypothetical protein
VTRKSNLLALPVVAFAVAALAPAAVAAQLAAGGCQISAHATLSGLTLSSKTFTYHYSGKLFGCVYTSKHAAHSGVISAGETIRIRGHSYQEPVPSGSGTCLETATTGYDFARWSNGTQTIVQFTTTGGSGGTHLFGTIVPKLTLAAIRPSAGSPKSTTFKTTEFLGQTAVGALTFAAVDPALCAGTGVTHAAITGLLGHVGLVSGTRK